MAASRVPSRTRFEVREVPESDRSAILLGHALLQREMGAGEVEHLAEFMKTVSSVNSPKAVPKIVCAIVGREVVGFNVGVYLRGPEVGFIAYSAVERGWRRNGVYTAMRERLVATMKRQVCENGTQLRYVVTELDESSLLLGRYLNKLNAFVAPCEYEQPAVQGLRSRCLKLVLQPVGRAEPPGAEELVAIVREIFERVYRVVDVSNDPTFRGIVASMGGNSVAVLDGAA